VLVVDDDPDYRTFMRDALEPEGFIVRTAVDGHDALRLLAEQTPEAVILDMAMPNASGLAVLGHIRSQDAIKHLPVIVVSATDEHDDLWQGRTWGWDRYIAKPPDIDQLVSTLRDLVAERSTTGGAS
jgi:two-component system response regulator PrrA